MLAPVDIYENDVDFTALALQYPGFAKRLKPNGQLDFTDPESVRQLTKALLHRDFNLTITLPEDRLCPPVPNRFNYVNFIQKLVDTTRFDYVDGHDPSSKTLALDIGTGASAIYPLLICRQRTNWYCLATEIDPRSRQYALKNIKANNLESNIRLVDTDQSGQTILPSYQFEHLDSFAIKIMLTNPPFYTSQTELSTSANTKSRPPNSACTGAPVEMITPGGEVQFITSIIHESLLPLNCHKVQWFSSMLGKYSSLAILINLLKQLKCTNYAVTEFVQGQKTRRWCLAWSWAGLRPPTSLARGIPSLEKNLLPFPAEYIFDCQTPSTELSQTLNVEFSKLDLTWHPSSLPLSLSSNQVNTHTQLDLVIGIGIGISPQGDVWSRRARRQRPHPPSHLLPTVPSTSLSNPTSIDQEMKDPSPSPSLLEVSAEPQIAFKISLFPTPHSSQPQNRTRVTIRWLQGHDSVLFESLCGWIKRKIV